MSINLTNKNFNRISNPGYIVSEDDYSYRFFINKKNFCFIFKANDQMLNFCTETFGKNKLDLRDLIFWYTNMKGFKSFEDYIDVLKHFSKDTDSLNTIVDLAEDLANSLILTEITDYLTNNIYKITDEEIENKYSGRVYINGSLDKFLEKEFNIFNTQVKRFTNYDFSNNGKEFFKINNKQQLIENNIDISSYTFVFNGTCNLTYRNDGGIEINGIKTSGCSLERIISNIKYSICKNMLKGMFKMTLRGTLTSEDLTIKLKVFNDTIL